MRVSSASVFAIASWTRPCTSGAFKKVTPPGWQSGADRGESPRGASCIFHEDGGIARAYRIFALPFAQKLIYIKFSENRRCMLSALERHRRTYSLLTQGRRGEQVVTTTGEAATAGTPSTVEHARRNPIAGVRTPIVPRHFGRLGLTECCIIGFCVGVITLIWVLTLERVESERGEAIRETVRRNANLVLGFEELSGPYHESGRPDRSPATTPV